jgi:hypothetical protein
MGPSMSKPDKTILSSIRRTSPGGCGPQLTRQFDVGLHQLALTPPTRFAAARYLPPWRDHDWVFWLLGSLVDRV